MSTGLTGRIVTPDAIVDGRLVMSGGRIAAIEPAPVPSDAPWLVPGFVDMHVHGGGGHTFTTGRAPAARAAAAFHLSHGTTTLLASLVSSPYDAMLAATKAYAPLVASGVLAGVHYEGPYLAESRCGAQNPAFLRPPALTELASLLEVGAGAVRMVTLAPELDGALDAIRLLVAAGVVVAIGHTDADYRQVRTAIDAGATVGTHVFNGMAPPHHRAPGPAYALLGSPAVTCEFVADGAHLADETLEFAFDVVGAGRAALVTDAIAAAGMPDGSYELGGQAVVVANGIARLAARPGSTIASSTIAGSTLTMDAAFRRAFAVTGSIVFAAHAAATTPARALGLTDRGSLAVGQRADVVTLGPDLAVEAVRRGGRTVRRPATALA
ncbi:MAG TPA: amidohydrolase family protein [Micromonosporaceae bacterium]|nr:amidohydrolase family protein [Micromonosporaceae bacterium]